MVVENSSDITAKELTNEIQFYSKRFGKIEDQQKLYSIQVEVDNNVLETIEDTDDLNSKNTSYDSSFNSSFMGEENHTLSVLIVKDLKFQSVHDDKDAMYTLSNFSLNGIHVSSVQSLNENKSSV